MKVHTDVSGVDGAMVGILQGDTRARCHYCSANRAQCNSLLEILNGFYITKRLEECQRVWDMLENGTMDSDDPARGGQCHEPLVGCKFFGVLYKELRSFDFIQLIYYRLVAGIYDCDNSKTSINKASINRAKQDASQHVRDTCGFLMDTPSSSGGSTNSGGLAKRFLDPTTVPRSAV